MSTKPYDQAFKYLAEEDPRALLLLLGAIQPGEDSLVELLPREVSIAARLPDQPYKVTIGDKEEIVHVGAQTVYEPDVPERMLGYAVRLWLKHELPITSYLLLLTDRNSPQRLTGIARAAAGGLRIELTFVPVRLSQMSANNALDLNRDSLLPFIPLMNGGPEAVETGAQRLGAVRGERERQELSLHFLLLGGLRYNREDLLDLIGRQSMIPIEQLKESSFYQYILEEGREEGREEGLQRGLEEGVRKGEVAFFRRQLEHRFGALPDWVVKKIQEADRTALERWGTDLLQAASLKELFN
jgi:hypothetical protein